MAAIIRKPGQSQYSSLDQQDFTYDSNIPQRAHTTPQVQHHVRQSQPTMSGAKREIYLALACILIPMLGLSGIIIGLVLGYRVEESQTGDSPLARTQNYETDDSAYYVDINSTTFATIASWSSTIAPLLVMCVMALTAFPAARKIKERSSSDSTDLPTPYQLSLLLESLTGSMMSVWHLIRYRRWQHRQTIASMVRSSFLILFVATIVGWTVAGIDTWYYTNPYLTFMIQLTHAQAPFSHGYG